MPGSPNSINLVSTKTDLSPGVELIIKSLRRACTIAMILFLFAGVVAGTVYYYYYSLRSSLEARRDVLRNQISLAKNKEGLLISIKERTQIVQKVMKSQRPLAEILKLLGTIAAPPILTSVSVAETSKIEFTIEANSIDDILPAVEGLIAYSRAGKVHAPEIQSLQIGKDGEVTISIAFNAVF